MKSQQWVMNLFFIIGVPLFVIGLTLFGTGLFMRRRTIRKNRNPSKFYSKIDLEAQLVLEQPSLGVDVDRSKRISQVKSGLANNYVKLDKLAGDQMVYNKLIIEKGINTYEVVNNKIVYGKFMMSNYPDLHQYLVKLHKIQHNIRYFRKELSALSKDDIGDTMNSKLNSIRDNQENLIQNSEEMSVNSFNRKQNLENDPKYDFISEDTYIHESISDMNSKTKPEMNSFLRDKNDNYMITKTNLEQILGESKNNYRTWEQNQISVLK